MSRIWNNGRQVGKALFAEQMKEDALSRGKTVVEYKDGKATSRRRVYRKGRSLDVVEDVKPAPFGGSFQTASAGDDHALDALPYYTAHKKTPEA